jgi:hypothetical protein
MNASLVYILIAILILVILAVQMFLVARGAKRRTLTPLAGVAFGFILAGIVFGENRILGYSLMGIGVLLAVIDIVQKSKKS